MVLKQYYDALAAMATGNTIAIASYGGATYNVPGSNAQNLVKLYNGMSSVAAGTWANGVLFGSGDTPVSIADNKLNSIISGLTGSGSVTKTYDAESGLTTISSIITITNGGDTDVTIKEVGLNLNYTGNWAMLMDRTVLEAPITIPAGGGIGQVTYEIVLKHPTAAATT